MCKNLDLAFPKPIAKVESGKLRQKHELRPTATVACEMSKLQSNASGFKTTISRTETTLSESSRPLRNV